MESKQPHELDSLKGERYKRLPDLTGMVFGRLTVLRFNKTHPNIKGRSKYICICICGKNKEVEGKNLARGKVRSCGCLIKDTKGNLRHTLSKSSEYHAWQGIKDRCNNPDCKSYCWYGARGIKVCKRWSGSKGFVNFIKDMGNKPTPKHSIDRINVNGNYSKQNCRWATAKEQSRNQRRSVVLTINGESKCATVWAEIANNVDSEVIMARKRKGTLSDYDCVYKPNKYPNGSPKKGIKLKKEIL